MLGPVSDDRTLTEVSRHHPGLAFHSETFEVETSPSLPAECEQYPPALRSSLQSLHTITASWAELARLEQEMCAKFSCLSSSQTELINQLTRESACKSSFNYLLMDPDITQNLPMKMFKVSDQELWRTFVSSIFYVGKGSRSRPFQHLYEAVRMLKSKSSKKPSDKIKSVLLNSFYFHDYFLPGRFTPYGEMVAGL